MTDEPKDAASEPIELDPTTQKDPVIGLRLGEYLVQERLGAGGMGVVYAGLQELIGKRVAIKVLQADLAHNPEETDRLIAEARLVNAIGHRGIVDIYSTGSLPDGRQYLVMELLQGEPLDEVIQRRAPLPVTEALGILDEICDALSAAHGAGVIHRDLKPNNVFLVTPPHGTRYVKLLDFGLAKRSTTPHGSAAQTRASMVVGTPYYMAPEQARGQAISPQTDLYSLGCMAFELLTGKLPFDAATPFEVISMHLNAQAPHACAYEPSVPEAVDALVDRLLAKVPTDRPQSAGAVRSELNRIKNRLQTDTTRVGTAAAARSGVERPTQPDLVPVAIGPTAVDQPALLTPVPTLAYGLGTQPAVPAAPALPTARPRRWLAPAFIGTFLVVAAGVAWFFLDTTKPAAEIEVPAPQPAPMPVEVRIPTKPIEVPPLPPPKSDPEPGPVKPVPRTDLRRPLMAPKLPKDPVVARPRATQEQVIACLEGYIVKMKGDAMYLQLLESNRKDASDPALLNKVIDGLHAFEKAHPDLVPGHDRHPPRISCLP